MAEREKFVRYLSDLGPALHKIAEGAAHPCYIVIEDLVVEKMPVVEISFEDKEVNEYLEQLDYHIQVCEDCTSIKNDYQEKKRGAIEL